MPDGIGIEEEKKKFITPKSIFHFLIAAGVMACYYVMINWALMEVQGLTFTYLWTSGSGGAGGGH